MPRPTPQDELLKGTLDMLILKTLTVQPMIGSTSLTEPATD